jgi:hypothetical protein
MSISEFNEKWNMKPTFSRDRRKELNLTSKHRLLSPEEQEDWEIKLGFRKHLNQSTEPAN